MSHSVQIHKQLDKNRKSQSDEDKQQDDGRHVDRQRRNRNRKDGLAENRLFYYTHLFSLTLSICKREVAILKLQPLKFSLTSKYLLIIMVLH